MPSRNKEPVDHGQPDHELSEEKPLSLAYSPCPNDTFIFHAWAMGLLTGAPRVITTLADIDVLNSLAQTGKADVIKLSAYAFAFVSGKYALLHSGAALGRGCGPLVVTRKTSDLRPAPSAKRVSVLADELARVRVAIPGTLTTAALLVGLLTGGLMRPVVMPYDRIMPACAAGEVDAGVIIHEGRFTYGRYGLRCLLDLGEWWEETSGLPLPLGVIAVARCLPLAMQERVERALRASVKTARALPEDAMTYVTKHARELEPEVCKAHIDLYVNDFTEDLGSEGEKALRYLLEAAADHGLAPRPDMPLFWDE